MEAMKVETMSKEIIKPSTKTPNDLRTLQLSIFDHLALSYTVAFLFYTKAESISEEDISHKLKTSLPETLTRFYAFAGRINGVTVDCNDEGAVFVDARVVGDFSLSSFLKSPDFDSLQQLLPLEDNAEGVHITWPLLLVKATYFQCGGMAIAICISHKLADATSLSTFVRAWAATAQGESDSVASPEFAAAKLFPPANEAAKTPEGPKKTNVTKRFVFVASKLEELRNKAASADAAGPRPTRVQSVTSLIWRCVVAAAASLDKTREKVLINPANLRPKIPTLLSENLIGNVLFFATTFNGKGEVHISETVKELRKRAEELASLIQEESSQTIGSKLISGMMNQFSKISDGTKESYLISSWCRMHFYEANFGWGSPVWVAGGVFPEIDNVTVLIDSNDGQGIEAWVTLYQEDMSLFEQNPELLAFASPNLNVLV